MRGFLSILGALLCASTVDAAGAFELLGTVHAGERPEPNVVVWLEAPDGSTSVQSVQFKRAVLDQRNSTFYPRVLAVRVGTAVDLPNDDRVFHNVFSFRDGKRFDVGLTYSLRRN